MNAPPRRIVTGHDPRGRSVIQEDGPPGRIRCVGADLVFYEIWHTRSTPAVIERSSGEPAEDGIVLAPPKNGTRIRIVDIPPDSEQLKGLSKEEAREHFEQIGAGSASTHQGGTKHAYMHRTESIDYGVVLDGELVLIMDEGETVVRTGDIVIQRGTNHAWANRSDRTCRIAFILIDGTFAKTEES